MRARLRPRLRWPEAGSRPLRRPKQQSVPVRVRQAGRASQGLPAVQAHPAEIRQPEGKLPQQVVLDSISVDVGSKGNPGIVEYKGVSTRTGEVIFEHPPIAKGTNNLGEFLAIVHALAYLKQQGSSMTVYSDSMTAMSWIRKKAVATTLPRDASTEEIWTLVDRALNWLHSNTYSNPILKWDTKAWGEIKADYGRK